MKRIINGLIFALSSLPVLAQGSDKAPERWYEVEIILFEQLKPVSTETELWPLDIEHPDLNESINLLRDPADAQAALTTPANANDPYLDTPYLILPHQQYQLADAYQKLVNSEDYLPLVHVAWRQIIPPRTQPDRILIHDQLNAAIEEASMKPEPVMPPPTHTDFLDKLSAEEGFAHEPRPTHNLSGIISLGLGRYIHVEADLLLYKPQPGNTVADKPELPIFSPPEPMQLPFDNFDIASITAFKKERTPELFRIQANLRMPSKEVHYLDHPLVGMLILFTPYEVPEPEEVIEELDNSNTNEDVILSPEEHI